MSNYPGNGDLGSAYRFISDAEQAAINKAEDALEAIESLPKRIHCMILEISIAHDLNVTKTAFRDAMAVMRDALDDMFQPDTNRLTDIAGDRLSKKIDIFETIINTLKPLEASILYNPKKKE